jgi:hypothetical protein
MSLVYQDWIAFSFDLEEKFQSRLRWEFLACLSVSLSALMAGSTLDTLAKRASPLLSKK